jgi:hypothetical protein
MIISASSRTDIPAFYGEWFRNRLDAGYCLSVNPFNGDAYRIGLSRGEVDGFFFWTKNIGPFLPQLDTLSTRGYPFAIHYTINGFPRVLEPSIISADRSIGHMHFIAKTYGPRAAIWRYDPIILTSITDFDFHRRNFARLARALAGAVDEVYVAYAHYAYRKTRRKMNLAAREVGFRWEDPEDERKREFLLELNEIAAENGIKLLLCGQAQYLSPGIREASCIDASRLSEISGRFVKSKTPGHRGDHCACNYSRDIGAYDTCLHGCTYCYAVNDFRHARRVYRDHDPKAEWLRPPLRLQTKKKEENPPLFCLDRQG